MITLRKLASLKEGTRQRKYVRLLRSFEERINPDRVTEPHSAPDWIYLKGLMRLMAEDEGLDGELRQKAGRAVTGLWEQEAPEPDEIRRTVNDLRHNLLTLLGMDPGDWDLMDPRSPQGTSVRKVLPVSLYLDDIRSPFNVGSLFRTAEAMGVEHIYLSPGTASPDHPRARRSAMGAVSMVPWGVLPLEELNREGIKDFFALELGGESPETFAFPGPNREGCMIVGSEELGVSPAGLELAEKSLGRVSLPMRGLKGSLNVAVAAGIVLYDWTRRFS